MVAITMRIGPEVGMGMHDVIIKDALNAISVTVISSQARCARAYS